MPKAYDVIYCDSCVILDSLHRGSPHHSHAIPIIIDAEKGKISIVVSVLCLCEVLAIQEKTTEESMMLIDAFFDNQYVNVYDVDDIIARKAAEIRRNSSLKTPDAIHVATAMLRGAQAIITRDDGILRLREALHDKMDVMTSEEFFISISSDSKQTELPSKAEHEEASNKED